MRNLGLASSFQWPWRLPLSHSVPSSTGGSNSLFAITPQSRRHLRATTPTNAIFRGPRFQFRFRPLPSYSILLAAQLIIIYAVLRELNTDNGHPGKEGNLLNTSTFSSYTLVHKENVSANSCILTLLPTALTATEDTASVDLFHILRLSARFIRDIASPNQALQIQKLKEYHDELWQHGVWSVEVKQPQLMISRRYTPLPPPATFSAHSTRKDGTARAEQIRLFVRREPQGEVSRYLHSLTEGNMVELRGGFIEYDVGNDVSEVMFIAGGTGIAPALGIANALAWKGSRAQVQVLWANRRREDCLGGSNQDTRGWTKFLTESIGIFKSESSKVKSIRSDELKSTLVLQLESLQPAYRGETTQNRPDLSIRYFVDEEGSMIQKADIAEALRSRSPRTTDLGLLNGLSNGRRLVLVSGPDGFVEYIAGPKASHNGIELQGSTGGLLAKVDLSGWEVRKL